MEALDISGRFRPTGPVEAWRQRWWGSTVRGALGGALKNLLCVAPRRPCESCQVSSCPYRAYWEPRRTDRSGPL